MPNMPNDIRKGQPVVFTARCGLMVDPMASRMVREQVVTGDRGLYAGPHPMPRLADRGWHVVSVVIDDVTLYAPVRLDMIRALP